MASPKSSPHHVLVLEDEPLIQMDLEGILLDLGCGTVTSVTTAEEAIAALDVGPRIEFAVLDIHLAKGTSYKVAAALEARNVKFIFISRSAGEELPDRFSRVPFSDKPFHRGRFTEQLRGALDGAEA